MGELGAGVGASFSSGLSSEPCGDLPQSGFARQKRDCSESPFQSKSACLGAGLSVLSVMQGGKGARLDEPSQYRSSKRGVTKRGLGSADGYKGRGEALARGKGPFLLRSETHTGGPLLGSDWAM